MMFDRDGVKKKLVDWALGVGGQVAALREKGEPPPSAVGPAHARRPAGPSKVRDRFGGRVEFFISGSAALNPDVARWFPPRGLLIIEGYGLTETSAATCVNRPRPVHFGSVGWPLPGTQVRIADDGESSSRAPASCAATTTARGDGRGAHRGRLVPHRRHRHGRRRGFVKITDRKKDLFKTSGGKYIAPSIIETMFKGICPYVSQFVVIGEGRNYASALITLDPDALPSGPRPTAWPEEYAARRRPAEAAPGDGGYVDELNSGLNRWETIKGFPILDRDLTVDEGELTPSLKLRRKIVERYADVLNSISSGTLSTPHPNSS